MMVLSDDIQVYYDFETSVILEISMSKEQFGSISNAGLNLNEKLSK
jgi:hypothetical protein